MREDSLRHTLLISSGDLTDFFTRIIAAAFLGMASLCLLFQMIPAIPKSKDTVLKE
jgi:TctA family transporter